MAEAQQLELLGVLLRVMYILRQYLNGHALSRRENTVLQISTSPPTNSTNLTR